MDQKKGTTQCCLYDLKKHSINYNCSFCFLKFLSYIYLLVYQAQSVTFKIVIEETYSIFKNTEIINYEV